MSELSEKKTADAQRFLRLFPWYGGFGSDLLFWVAIDTLFLSTVKGLSTAQIVSLTSYSMLFILLFQIPMTFLMNYIGNRKSVIICSTLALCSALCLTFGKGYPMMIVGNLLRDTAYTFGNAVNAMLKNNLDAVGKSDQYIRYRSRSTSAYSVFTMIISFVAGFLFNLNPYFPMILCILCCVIAWGFAVFLTEPKVDMRQAAPKQEGKIPISAIIIFVSLFFCLYFPTANSGQTEGKLFIQDTLLGELTVEKVSLLISAMLCVSRITRVFSNILFSKLFDKVQTRVIFMFIVLLPFSLLAIILGAKMQGPFYLRYGLMTAGYAIILFLRDPFKNFSQWVLLEHTERKYQITLLSAMELMRKTVRLTISSSFTALLLHYDMSLVMYILLGLTVPAGVIGIILFTVCRKRSFGQ